MVGVPPQFAEVNLQEKPILPCPDSVVNQAVKSHLPFLHPGIVHNRFARPYDLGAAIIKYTTDSSVRAPVTDY